VRSRQIWGWCSAALVGLSASLSSGESIRQNEPRAPSAACAAGTALRQLVCELAPQIGQEHRVSLSYGTRAPDSAWAPVGAKLQALLAEELRRRPRASKPSWWPGGSGRANESSLEIVLEPQPVSLAELEKPQATRGLRLFLELSEHAGRLVINAYSAGRPGFWARVRGETAAERRVSLSVRADASVRTLLPKPSLTLTVRESYAYESEAPLALACMEEIPGEGLRVAMAGRTYISIARLAHGKLTQEQRLLWKSYSEVAPVPLREPLVSVAFRKDGALDVGSSDRRFTLRISAAGVVLGRFPDVLPWPGIGCLGRSGVGLAGQAACGSEPGAPSFQPVGVFDAAAGVELVTAEGVRVVYGALRELLRAQASLFQMGQPVRNVPDVGASLALADLDGDGLPEILSSRPTFEPEADALEVRGLDNLSVPKARLPITDGVVALAVCPWMGEGHNPILVASRSKLWVVK